MRVAGNVAVVERREDPVASLIARTGQGDEAALSALYDATVAQVHGLVLRIVRDPSAAEEVTGDVFLQVWRQSAHYDPSRGSPLAWLLMLARTRAIDRVRSRGQERGRLEPLTPAVTNRPGDDPGPDETSSAMERRRIVHEAMLRLPAEQRRVVELAYFAGLSHTEIAEAIGDPLGTVKTRARLGVARLRDLLADRHEDLR